MSLKYAILATLADCEMSGYELAKHFDIAIANFWHATAQQIYAELNRMEHDALVTATTVIQEGRPNKRIYRLTTAGEQSLRAWGALPSGPESVKDELLIKLYGAGIIDVAAIIRHIEARRAERVAKLTRYQYLRDELLNGDDELTFIQKGTRVGPYLALTSGLSYEADAIAWCDRTLALLAAYGAAGNRTVTATGVPEPPAG